MKNFSRAISNEKRENDLEGEDIILINSHGLHSLKQIGMPKLPNHGRQKTCPAPYRPTIGILPVPKAMHGLPSYHGCPVARRAN